MFLDKSISFAEPHHHFGEHLQSRIFEVACVIEEKPRRYYAALDMQMFVLIFSKLLINRTFVAKVACVLSGVPTRLLSCTRHCGVWVDVLEKSISRMPNSRCQLAERSMCHRGKTSFLLMQYHGQFVVEIASLLIWTLLRNNRRPSVAFLWSIHSLSIRKNRWPFCTFL